ncbi:uncharacterized protein GIQ15_06627 [Arthroderma uncinatum]|uniref:uncharacterized protein n=1 Tax=Arthroderma uncinatum TaxID=74035 RepID=UPI00144ACE5E|nr:uncharacterized protein GIQ15_06627 [Arthroderma uncinatum]KAF3479651.1 hypothetical protein GIQ15_06627 [Arthroderma uncinatum]
MAARGESRPRCLGSNNPNIPHPASIDRPIFSEEWGSVAPSGYRVTDHMINEPRPGKESFKIIMVGCGPAGIDFLHHVTKEFGPGSGVEFACFDKNHDVGGTWLENRYPGCACDVPSASYQFPWRPNPDWTRYYSPSKEIWEYFRKIVEEEGMMKYIRLRTTVTHAEWDEDRSKWSISLEERDTADKIIKTWVEECDLLLSGTGILNAWKWPDIPGIMSFKGKLFHTARYDEGYDLRGKRIAVIGSGSSGVQTVASIYNDAARVYTWVRTPTWVTAGFGQKFAGEGGSNFAYDEAQKEIWRSDPEKYRRYRKMVENELNGRFRFILRNSKESDDANEFSYNEMTSKLGDNQRLKDNIIPTNFNVGCRRATPGNGYLEALVGEKTTCYTEGIKRITEKGFLDPDGREVEVDVIICATGFDTTFRPRFPIIGLDKQDLATRWAEEPDAYVAVGVPRVPNYFTYTGPYGPLAQGSVLPLLTLYSNYFMQVIKKMRKEHIRRLSPKESAAAAFREHAKVYLQRTAWSDACSSWFKQGRKDGNIVMWPGSRLAFFDVMSEPKFEDYEIEYWSGNRWGYLGSGFTTEEFDGESDISYYLNCRLYPEVDEAEKKANEEAHISETVDVNGLLLCTPGHLTR